MQIVISLQSRSNLAPQVALVCIFLSTACLTLYQKLEAEDTMEDTANASLRLCQRVLGIASINQA